ncbi:MAG: sulfatase-like hydrolase/transferase [Planctomycetota bacterium]
MFTRSYKLVRSGLLIIGVVIISGFMATVSVAQPQPNIILVYLDQLRAYEVAAYNHPPMISFQSSTPNMDLVAQQGFLFEYAFVGQPICAPSRACVQTGRLPASVRTTSGVPGQEWFTKNQYNLNLSEVTIAEELNKYGYTCAHVGRWHLNTPNIDLPGPGEAERQGYSFMEGINSWGGYLESRWYDNNGTYHSEPGRWLPESTTDRAIQFLNQYKDDTFFLQISWFPPHSRNDWQVDVGMEEMLTPAYWYLWEGMYDTAAITFWPPNVPSSDYAFAQEQCRKYHALTRGVDEQFGQVLVTLANLNIDDKTIIMISSDHGEDMGSHGHFSKVRIYEESIRVPLIVYDPRNSPAPQQVRTELISQIDFLPTFVELAGGSSTERSHGKSFAPLITGQGTYQSHPGILVQLEVTEYPEGTPWGRTRAYRTHDWKIALMEWGRGTGNLVPKALFDMQSDPYEMNNLVDDPAYESIRDQMVQDALAEMQRTEDSVLIPGDPPPPVAYIDMGNVNINVGVTNITSPGDGGTSGVTIGGRNARKNDNNYFYFDVVDTFAYGGTETELYVTVEYYDTGSGSFQLQYDSNNGDEIADRYKGAEVVQLGNTNSWQQYTYHLTDAYFAGRQNGSSDFRISGMGNTIYLDIVEVRKPQASGPDPYNGAMEVSVTADLHWSAGGGAIGNKVYFGDSDPPSYIGQQAGTTYDPSTLDSATTYHWRIDTVTAGGTVTGESWSFVTGSIGPDIDVDGDVDLEDFGLLQACYSGSGMPHRVGCEKANQDQDNDVDLDDYSIWRACLRGANVPLDTSCIE